MDCSADRPDFYRGSIGIGQLSTPLDNRARATARALLFALASNQISLLLSFWSLKIYIVVLHHIVLCAASNSVSRGKMRRILPSVIGLFGVLLATSSSCSPIPSLGYGAKYGELTDLFHRADIIVAAKVMRRGDDCPTLEGQFPAPVMSELAALLESVRSFSLLSGSIKERSANLKSPLLTTGHNLKCMQSRMIGPVGLCLYFYVMVTVA